MRSARIVARSALIAVLALVALPALATSTPPSIDRAADESAFSAVNVTGTAVGSATTMPSPDPAFRSTGYLDASDALGDVGFGLPEPSRAPRPTIDQPTVKPIVVVLNPWRYDRNISFYGPGFYGKRTACGLAYTTTLMGVAHRTLPCGTMVTFRNPANGRTVTVPVVDRGPYVAGRTWDLTGAACTALGHCYTGSIYWKFG